MSFLKAGHPIKKVDKECIEKYQLEWEDGSCYDLFDQGPCEPFEELVADNVSPSGFKCRRVSCPYGTVPFGGIY
jgi:hypothetical protein